MIRNRVSFLVFERYRNGICIFVILDINRANPVVVVHGLAISVNILDNFWSFVNWM